ncbi:NAD(P)-binding protein, partial [Candidatus Bathyarchaeota archaeon]|nr:NAD(P)-binding protein [Candidatus Bathyarchaeota archaeon]
MEEKKVIIIGTGIGGLSVAGFLANNGYSVEMHDKQDQVGGKATKLELDGFRFDKGPSLMTMPHVMKDFFSEVGESIDHHLELMALESICRYFWSDGTSIEEPADHE